MLKVVSILIGILILLIVFSKVASADYPCFADCPDNYTGMGLGNLYWACPTDLALNHDNYSNDCYTPIQTVMDANPNIGQYAWTGDIKHKSYMMNILATKVRHLLIE